MKTFKNQLDLSIDRHYKKTGEIITPFYVATQLWPKSGPQTQRVMLSRAINDGISLKVSHLKTLMEVFPDTPVMEWINVKPLNDE